MPETISFEDAWGAVPKETISFEDALSLPASNMTWGEAGQQALANAPSDAFNTAAGFSQQLASPGGQAGFGFTLATDPEARGALAEHFTNYLSPEGIKKNIAQTPVGTALDVATLFTPMKMRGAAPKAVAPAPKIASVAELKSGAGGGLEAAKNSGVFFSDEFVVPLRDSLVSTARKMNFRPGRPGSDELAHILKDIDAMSSRPWSFDDIQALGQDLNDAWKVSKKAGRDQIAGVAGRMRGVVNQFLDKVADGNGEGLYATGDLSPAQAAHIFQESNKVYRQAKVAQKLEAIGSKASVDAGQFAQSGEANALRKYARQTLRAHYDGKPTGLNAREIKTLEEFAKGSFSEWVIKQGARYFGGPIGAMVGASLGGPVGAAVGVGIGEGAKALGNRIAVQRFNRFVESVREEGSTRLESLLGQAVHEHLVGSPKGKAAVSNWVKRVVTPGAKGASKALALVVAQSVKQPALAPRIEAELLNLVESLQGTGPSEAQTEQKQ